MQKIEDYELMLIRQCKRNKTSINIMRRIYAKSRALSFAYCSEVYVIDALLEIIEKFNLHKGKLTEFVWDLNPNRDSWFNAKPRTFTEALFEKCVSVISLTCPAEDFPRYPSPAWFRNKHNQ